MSSILWLGLAFSANAGADSTAGRRRDFRPDRILVAPKESPYQLRSLADGNRLRQFHRQRGARVLRSFDHLPLEVVELPAGKDVSTALREYRESGLVDFAEPDYILRMASTPDDPAYADGRLWALNNTGQNSGKADADIDAPEAWEDFRFATNVIVAVIDTGIRYTHEDLAANMWRNQAEVASNGLDDDRNGYVDDVHGINAITNRGDPNDDNGHGTHVAGIIGAVGDNGKGTVGVAWGVRLMACKFMDAFGEGATSDAIECIDYARRNGATIINASWGGTDKSLALERAVRRARDAGVILVVAAGNEQADNDVTFSYPANYAFNNVISVAATTRQDELDSGYSNYGRQTVHLAAPGTRLYSTWNASDRAYSYQSGTSMAAPVVAGVLALVRARYPDDSHSDVIKRVLDGADRLSSLDGKCITGARVNLQRSLNGATGTKISPGLLAVAPSNQLNAHGFLGGPFVASEGSYHLSNDGAESLNWSAIANEPWLSVSPASGVLNPGETAEVAVILNEKAHQLSVGEHLGSLLFKNASSGTVTEFQAAVTILAAPELVITADLTEGYMKFEITSPIAHIYVLEASSDLRNWRPISTNAVEANRIANFREQIDSRSSARFFRSKLAPADLPAGIFRMSTVKGR